VTSSITAPQWEEFCETLRRLFGPMSVTSWYRSVAHNATLPGASPHSKHLTGRAIDVLWDKPPPLDAMANVCRAWHFRMLREATHDHIETAD
jgi:uncharacterized protein YcbK (DUF882 family)